MENRYGLEISYFSKELEKLKKSLPNITPYELYRWLSVLGDVAKSASKEKEPKPANEKETERIKSGAR